MASQHPSATPRRLPDSSQAEVTIGQFKRLEEIGRGSFATVYKGLHVKKGALVAIKSVHLQKLNKKLKDNLYSEIHILKGLHHPHIVALIDCQESSAHIHLVMEFCQLGDLSYFIKKRDKLSGHAATAEMIKKYPNPPGGGLNEVVVRHFLKQLASALEFLRARNFIHRDVKPQNLLLNPSPLWFARAQPEVMPLAASENSLVPIVGVESLPMLKIADFGFARSLPSTSLAETLCGSPLYMAPEILRYEKYDAKADLWSVGTVLYEMVVGKPPFRASNHVELLRKIERGEDRIKFPEDTLLSDGMKRLIRSLLKRNPVERLGFKDFFDNAVVRDDIPGLVGEDRPRLLPKRPSEGEPGQVSEAHLQSKTSASREQRPLLQPGLPQEQPEAPISSSPGNRALQIRQQASRTSSQPMITRRLSGTPPRTGNAMRPGELLQGAQPDRTARGSLGEAQRPHLTSHATAPARQDLYPDRVNPGAAEVMQRKPSRASASPSASLLNEQLQDRERKRRDDQALREERERAAQDVAFERDYVVVEKRAVEVNAFADELAASPQLRGNMRDRQSSSPNGPIVRRATVQGAPSSAPSVQPSQSRAMQIASGKPRPDPTHHRKSSYDRRYGSSPSSATSAISKALNMANFRLFGMGFSPPVGKGPSPPQVYGAFPAYPTGQSSLIMVGESPRPSDEDSKAIHVVEESATRSDVVYGFAEVKYKQLIPLAPSAEHGLGLRQAGLSERDGAVAYAGEDEGLTVDAIVTLSEEALVLYVKALSLLANCMDIAGTWWSRKNRGEVIFDQTTGRAEGTSATSLAAGARINNVVQWVRNRFNEVLEKAEFVRLKLVEAQRRLPLDHPSHPNNHPSASTSTTGMGTSADNVVVSSGVTAEKLMYDRALEMSRAAAVNELVSEDLPGCEIAYVTAIRMLEAIIESDMDPLSKKGSSTDRDKRDSRADAGTAHGMEAEDRQVVEKPNSNYPVVISIRGRLGALRKKMAVLSKRNSIAQAPPIKSRGSTTPTPVIATTPPK
ncbi:Serine/threonine-protein kinase atg1 [Xylona heveae TC161]|uniref:Serine/threonine-protein kinase ATG1 n=1 Tax=Xylona heveae (strain CBS 132557 / TC161) TaxID=1328760 RepID=A0A165IEE3_XYLHT|nr:Serine/threonine-protein kinase atg1 [Xylona heveae TC161]KZF24778.1 Serine/threonine-protein kinase atg1 [Xylona heveae TC161]